MLRRLLVLAYGSVSYALGLIALLYAVGFIGGFVTPTQLDGPRQGPAAAALAVDLALISLFALQHSGMARPAFKRWWTRLVPVAMERSTYVLLSAVALMLLFWWWRPIGGVVWEVEGSAVRALLYAAFTLGWLLVLGSSFLINHFDLFGLRQVWLYFLSRPYTRLRFATPVLYRFVRHPLYVGWLLAFWATPRMTSAHLVFAAALTTYILAAIRWEERDLAAEHPEYVAYRRHVPMLIPRWPRTTAGAETVPARSTTASSASLDTRPAS
jgi:protein-S-isoprenylcysteine O-methyltransferase Ste14